MTKINHRPYLNTDYVAKFYSEKDGVEVRYVCTSSLGTEAYAMDIFYRETPHPKFGNRYFGLCTGVRGLMIADADDIEKVEFGMIKINDEFQYSRHRHDFYQKGGVAIDGGRAYLRLVGDVGRLDSAVYFRVKDGEFERIVDDKD
jgi:hypothetical protein